MKTGAEKKIRTSAILVYIIVALLCGGILIYYYIQEDLIRSQKQKIEESQQTLSLTNSLIAYVNQAQVSANLYIASKDPEHIAQFATDLEHVQVYVDSLQSRVKNKEQAEMLNDIEVLLSQKTATISDLNIQFDSYGFVDSLRQRLETHSLSLLNDTTLLAALNKQTVTTTTTEEPGQKGFFKRLAEAFVPPSAQKPQTTTTTTIEETIIPGDSAIIVKPVKIDTKPLLTDLLAIAHKTGKKYARQISAIEKQIATLMASDQEISLQLEYLLLKLHEQTIESTIEEVHKNETLIQKNHMQSLIGIAGSLILGLVLIILIIRNATQSYRARKAVEEAHVLMQETMESRHKLLLAVSHDVKTPINSILGYADLWRHGHPIAEKEVAAIQNSGQHILDMMGNLLEFSRLEQGVQEVALNDFGLAGLCSEITEIFDSLMAQKNLNFETCFDFDKSLRLHSDKLKIKQILTNILSNSFKYTTTGSVRFEASYKNETLSFIISDTGKGIPAKDLKTIYEPFMRVTQNNALASGSGFGLFVVKGFVELLNGTVSINSKVGIGTTVSVSIPAKEGVAIEQEVNTKIRKILVIDDDVSFLSMIKEMLLKLGHDTDTCSSEEECSLLFDQSIKYDVIITDAEMGTFSGYKVLEKFKQKQPETPVILMTGQRDFGHNKAAAQSFDGYLQKPISMSSLKYLLSGNITASSNFVSLEELFGNDQAAINKIINSFVETTKSNITELKQAVADNNFVNAQALCHKMLPMFTQLRADSLTLAILRKMDRLKGKAADSNLDWKTDMEKLTSLAETFIKTMKNTAIE